MIRKWVLVLALGWTGIVLVATLALLCGLAIGMAVAGDPAALNRPLR